MTLLDRQLFLLEYEPFGAIIFKLHIGPPVYRLLYTLDAFKIFVY